MTVMRLGPWEIDPIGRVVSSPAGTRRLEPKPMSLLLYLASHAGEVVPRQDLLNAAWGDEMATDDVLSRAISELRRALGDDLRKPVYVETIRGAGYRLLVPDVTSASTPTPLVSAGAQGVRNSTRAWWFAAAALVAAAGLGVWGAVRHQSNAESSPDPHLVPITSAPGEAMGPRLSPDGTRIAYAWSDSTQSTPNLFVQTIDGAGRLQLTNVSGRAPAWSPDGSNIAFVMVDGAGSAIAQISSLGGSPRVLARVPVAPILGIDWSPDGRQIAFSSHDAPFSTFRINLVSADSLAVRGLTAGGHATVGDAFPVFSPDGQSVAFARFVTETSADLYIARVDTRAEQRLTFDDQNITALAFTPDGQAIVFASDRDGGSAVWQVSVRGGRAERLLGSDRKVTGLTYARTPGGLVVTAAEHEQHLWSVPVAGSKQMTMLLESTRVDGVPSFAPDDRRVAFISDRSGAPELWLASAAGDSAVQLTHAGGFAGMPSWSPDGGRIIVGRRTATTTELWIVDVGRRAASRLPVTVRMPIAPTWSRDGGSIVVGSNESGTWELWRVSLSGAAPVRLTQHGGIRGVESSDGGSLFFTRPSAAGLWARDLSNGTERLLVASVLPGDWTNWAVGRRNIYFVDRDSTGKQRIVEVDLATERQRVVLSPVRIPMGTGGLAISNDERRLMFGQVDRREGNMYRAVMR
jgi:Tol biopolymer transport system component/DNA-binding winged helix-turn-helix (wHTH) protein